MHSTLFCTGQHCTVLWLQEERLLSAGLPDWAVRTTASGLLLALGEHEWDRKGELDHRKVLWRLWKAACGGCRAAVAIGWVCSEILHLLQSKSSKAVSLEYPCAGSSQPVTLDQTAWEGTACFTCSPAAESVLGTGNSHENFSTWKSKVFFPQLQAQVGMLPLLGRLKPLPGHPCSLEVKVFCVPEVTYSGA
ncbi:hypothetical protein EK904_000573 [Melospiza melodia maxima]|nr:hypothetical protein EK904_000573 [Melospiza melodia maxima]